MKRCLCCYKPMMEGDGDYHPRCARKLSAWKSQIIIPLHLKEHKDYK